MAKISKEIIDDIDDKKRYIEKLQEIKRNHYDEMRAFDAHIEKAINEYTNEIRMKKLANGQDAFDDMTMYRIGNYFRYGTNGHSVEAYIR